MINPLLRKTNFPNETDVSYKFEIKVDNVNTELRNKIDKYCIDSDECSVTSSDDNTDTVDQMGKLDTTKYILASRDSQNIAIKLMQERTHTNEHSIKIGIY